MKAIIHQQIRKLDVFHNPKINFKATNYHKMTPSVEWQTIPPILQELENDEIHNLTINPFNSNHECHSQIVERHIKSVTEASSAVVGQWT